MKFFISVETQCFTGITRDDEEKRPSLQGPWIRSCHALYNEVKQARDEVISARV